MKIWILIFINISILSSCSNFETEKFNQEAYDEYIQKSSRSCSINEGDFLYVDMNKPNFEFYLYDKKLNFNGLEKLDSFIRVNPNGPENYRICLVGKENVRIERIDSVFSLFHKYNRFRFNLLYQKGFWEK